MEIVNFKQYGSKTALFTNFLDSWVYVGRANSFYDLPASPLANPYDTKRWSREECIEKYRVWLWRRIKAVDSARVTALACLEEDSVLVCWCHPEPCHAEVIIKAHRWMKANRPDLFDKYYIPRWKRKPLD